jgi:integrase
MTAFTVTEERLGALLADASIPAPHRALWALLWEGEIRLDEALMLDIRDFDLDRRTARLEFRVKPGPHAVPVGERTAMLLREAFAGEAEGPAIQMFGRPVSQRGVALQARRHGVSIHAFRTSGQAAPWPSCGRQASL